MAPAARSSAAQRSRKRGKAGRVRTAAAASASGARSGGAGSASAANTERDRITLRVYREGKAVKLPRRTGPMPAASEGGSAARQPIARCGGTPPRARHSAPRSICRAGAPFAMTPEGGRAGAAGRPRCGECDSAARQGAGSPVAVTPEGGRMDGGGTGFARWGRESAARQPAVRDA